MPEQMTPPGHTNKEGERMRNRWRDGTYFLWFVLALWATVGIGFLLTFGGLIGLRAAGVLP